MDLYIAELGNERFYIQPDRIELYANAGYTIYKLVEEKITDVQEELANMDPTVYTGKFTATLAESGERDD